ncbi:MAG: shikimate dehydrogenase [Alistipes sp.]|jgi:shikimate dehydrogenase|nr:shikimate dehydrogenase [Alistipes sp.]
MRHFGLIGKSLGHSFSAKFFNGKFRAEGIDADYQLFEMDDVSAIDKLIAEHNLEGFNVTIPYKESIIPHLDGLTKEAHEIGAVNCVVINNGQKIGHNTDITGIEASLHWLDIDSNPKALILGTGGASKAVQYALKRRGIEFKVVSRDSSRGDITYDKLTAEVIAQHKLIINATPVGMTPNVEDAPSIDYSAVGTEHRLFDLVYNPAKTEFLKRGEAQGAKTMGGMLMLQTQAIASWHLWNEKEKPETAQSQYIN